jgi:hypothetical protein
MANKPRNNWSKKKRIIIASLGIFALIYIAAIMWHTFKPLPKGISYEGELHKTEKIEMITDLTYSQDTKGKGMVHENNIFDAVYTMIEEAEEFVVVDFFLLDGYYDEKEDFPKIADTLSTKLADKKKENPDMPVVFITDPLNRGYGSYFIAISVNNVGMAILTILFPIKIVVIMRSGFAINMRSFCAILSPCSARSWTFILFTAVSANQQDASIQFTSQICNIFHEKYCY